MRQASRISDLCILLAIIAAAGCERQADEGRHILAELTDTVWSWSATMSDTVLLNPVGVASDGSLFYVLDRGQGVVYALDAEDGDILWAFGDEGEGPGEFRSPGSMVGLRSGGVAVADRGTGRITLVSQDGALSGTLRLPNIPDVHGICAPREGELMVFSARSESALNLVSHDGAVLRRMGTPWADLDTASVLVRQLTLASGLQDGCWVMLGMGRGMTFYTGVGFAAPQEYVEPIDLPRVERTESRTGDRVDRVSTRLIDRWTAARQASGWGDFVLVAFGGLSQYQKRIVDIYDRGMDYRGSWITNDVFSEVTAVGDVVLLLRTDVVFPSLTAYRVQAP